MSDTQTISLNTSKISITSLTCASQSDFEKLKKSFEIETKLIKKYKWKNRRRK